MVARSNQQAKLKLAMAAGGATIFIFLAVLGGVVGWFSRNSDSPESLSQPEVKLIYKHNLSSETFNFYRICWERKLITPRKMVTEKLKWMIITSIVFCQVDRCSCWNQIWLQVTILGLEPLLTSIDKLNGSELINHYCLYAPYDYPLFYITILFHLTKFIVFGFEAWQISPWDFFYSHAFEAFQNLLFVSQCVQL